MVVHVARSTNHGNLEPIVALHGFTGARDSFSTVFESLPTFVRTLAVRLPGHHADVPVAAGFVANVDVVAHALSNRLLPTLGVSRCHVLGYSLGARIALGLAARYPSVVAQLTLIGVHPGLVSESQRVRRIAADRRWIEILRTRGIRAFVAAWQEHPIFGTQKRLPAEVLKRQRDVRLSHDPDALADSLQYMGLGVMPDYRAAFADLSMPVTLISGALDHKFAALAQELTHFRSHTRIVQIDGAGHNPVLEQPRALAHAVLEYA